MAGSVIHTLMSGEDALSYDSILRLFASIKGREATEEEKAALAEEMGVRREPGSSRP